jgi:hypothetical protein
LRQINMQQSTMATAAPPILVLPDGALDVDVMPQLPNGADPGTITGWLLEASLTKTLDSISSSLEQGFHRLVHNIPIMNGVWYDAMHAMSNDVINSDTIVPYLVMTNIGNDLVQVTVVYLIARYSAGFGGRNSLHGCTLALLGKTVGAQLPMIVQFSGDPANDLLHALGMEEVTVPSDDQVETYFATATAEDLMPGTTIALGGINMNLSNLCLIPLAWAPYFLNFKAPYDAHQMGKALLATLDDVAQRTQVSPLLEWMRATCVQQGANAVG